MHASDPCQHIIYLYNTFKSINSSITKFAFMRNPQVYVLALIAKGYISLHARLKIANQNGQ